MMPYGSDADDFAQSPPERPANVLGLDVVAVARTEPSDGVQGCTSMLVVGGEKRWARVYDGTTELDWGWTLHASAVVIWTAHGFESWVRVR